jgi:hypothetical protein
VRNRVRLHTATTPSAATATSRGCADAIDALRHIRNELAAARATSVDVRTSAERTQSAIRDLTRRAVAAERDAERLRDHLEAADEHAVEQARQVRRLTAELAARGAADGPASDAPALARLAGLLLATMPAAATSAPPVRRQTADCACAGHASALTRRATARRAARLSV